MDELLYCVRDVFSRFLKNSGCVCFNIPEYQRGYKWTSSNVTQLLEDLKKFQKVFNEQNDNSLFYCLQNITVSKSSLRLEEGTEIPCLNVIDGQQRLTTLFLLISFLQKKRDAEVIIDSGSNILQYSIRQTTNVYLKQNFLQGCIWDSDINPDSADHKDKYYIMEVASAIKNWFDANELAPEMVYDHLYLIVNKISDGDEETVFASLNGGKVDLDGSDLMRAILITRAAKQKYRNIGPGSAEDSDSRISYSDKVSSFRVKLGLELDEMNQWWSSKEVRTYFRQLLPDRVSDNKGFDIQKYPVNLLYNLFFEAYKGQFSNGDKKAQLSLRLMENGLDMNDNAADDHLEFYNLFKDFHHTMVDWFRNDTIYNLVGYLMYNFKSAEVSFEALWDEWKAARTKDDFVKTIKDLIRESLAKAFEDDDMLTSLRKAIDDIHYDWFHNDFVKKLLPLLDVIPFKNSMKYSDKYSDAPRQDVEHFRAVKGEDKEHIRSQKRDLDSTLPEDEQLLLKEENENGLNSLGNIVLLTERVNKSYHNDNMSLKMQRIVSEDFIKENFIRPHTFHVFMSKLGNTSDNGVNDDEIFWSDDDLRRTVKDINERLESFFPLPAIKA